MRPWLICIRYRTLTILSRDTTSEASLSATLYETKFDIRVDHTFSANDNIFARFSYDDANSYVPGGFAGGFAEASAFGSNQGIVNHARNVAIGETHVFSATTVNTASFGYNRIFNYITSQGTGSCSSANLAEIGIPGANLGCTGAPGSATCIPGAYSCGLVSVSLMRRSLVDRRSRLHPYSRVEPISLRTLILWT